MKRVIIAVCLIAATALPAFSFGRGPRTDMTKFVGFAAGTMNMLPVRMDLNGATDFGDSVNYLLSGATISSTPVLSPSGAYDAQHLTEGSGGALHNVQSSYAATTITQTVVPYRLAVIAKAAERTRMVMYWQNFYDPTETVSVGFDLAGGNVGYDNVVGAGSSLVKAAMTSLGDGWWLCTIDAHYAVDGPSSGAVKVNQSQISIDAGSGTAARNVSYSGNGSSGIDIWWFSQLPAVAWSVNSPVLHDDFNDRSTIDVNNTKADGFNWYVNNIFPGSFMPTFGWEANPPSAPTQSSYLTSPHPGILEIYNPGQSNGFTSQLWSVVTTGTGTAKGHRFRPPLIFDGYFNWDGLNADFYAGWAGTPAFWAVPFQILTNTGTSPSSHWNEWDVQEWGSTGAPAVGGATGLHDWSNPPSPVNYASGAYLYYSMYPGSYVRLTGLWLTPQSTGTQWGLEEIFVNGRLYLEQAYSATSSPQPSDGTHVGAFSGSDNQDWVVILDTAEDTLGGHGGQAMFIDWVSVYTQ